MSLPVLPDRSNFLGVALVINRSRDGPRFVFHYPPHVHPVQGLGDKPASDADADAEDDDDIFLERPPRPAGLEFGVASSMPRPAERAGRKQDDHLFTDSGTQIVPWEHVAGFPTKDLESILTPARAYHKRLFQVSLDPLHCVSYPIYVPENGVWRKKKKKHRDEAAKSKRDDEDLAPADADGVATNGDANALDSEQIEVRDMARPAGKNGEENEDKKSSMTMFNLVFFLNPKKHEAKDLVDVLFAQIIKKINKVYKYCQQKSDFVWKESKRILAMKDKAREDKTKMSLLWSEILSASSLAASMQDLYEAVSQNKIAALQLDTPEGTVTHSVQIHRPFHISDLPQDGGSSNASGLWLTTANAFLDDEVLEEPGYRDKNFAILLMEDEKKIVTELQSDPDETSLAMVEFVRHCKATLSFHQVASQSSNILTLAQVRRFAEHFIFWRRAIAIPPLHGRDMYIVSPNCDLRKLPQATAQWARTFPLAPALPNFLAELSIAPRPYKAYSPGKAHRPLYMAMLGWLMRGGWVTQLCTFAYVVVWPEIVYEVEYTMEAEEIANVRKEQEQGGQSGSLKSDRTAPAAAASLSPSSSALLSPSALGFDNTDLGSSTATLRDLSLSAYPGHHARPVGQHESPESDQSSSPSSSFKADPLSPTSQRKPPRPEPSAAERAAEMARLERIANKAAREVAERATAHARKIPPTRTQHPSVNVATHLAGVTPHIILDAKKATGKESRYLLAIGQRLMEGATRRDQQAENPGFDRASGRLGVPSRNGPDGKAGKDKDKDQDKDKDGRDWGRKVAETWPLFWKYFNGRSALERVALQEEMKRKEVWNLLTAMSEYLLCVRHW